MSSFKSSLFSWASVYWNARASNLAIFLAFSLFLGENSTLSSMASVLDGMIFWSLVAIFRNWKFTKDEETQRMYQEIGRGLLNWEINGIK